MLLHTIVPYEAIFSPGAPADGAPGAQAQAAVPQAGESPAPGGVVQWVRDARGTHVSRLVSTDPRAYLNAAYAPGAPWHPRAR